MATISTRSRNEWDLSFRQATHGEKRHGQTPAGMFLETVQGSEECPVTNEERLPGGESRVAVFRRSRQGRLSLRATVKTRLELLRWALIACDGHLTAFEHDDYSARLIVLDGDGSVEWIEMLNPGSDGSAHPEIEMAPR